MKNLEELCSQAISDVDSIDNPDTQFMYIPDCFRDRYAQLIIEQCIKIACEVVGNAEGVTFGLEDEIREHFGITDSDAN